MSRPLGRWIAQVGVGTLCLGACASWQEQRARPQAVVEQWRPGQVRVVLRSDETVVLRHPRVVGDSLVGALPRTGASRSVALDEILATEVRRSRVEPVARTGIVTLGIVFSAGLLLAFLLSPVLAPS